MGGDRNMRRFDETDAFVGISEPPETNWFVVAGMLAFVAVMVWVVLKPDPGARAAGSWRILLGTYSPAP